MGQTGGPYERTAWPPVPRIWDGRTVCIFGAGPSLTQEQADQVKGQREKTIAVNLAYRLAPWADLLYACDANFWNRYQPKFDGLKITQDATVIQSGIIRVPSINKPGLSLDPCRIHQGANGGYQALNLAVLLGATKIILLGFDMREINNKKHFHPDHPTGMSNPYPQLFDQWITKFRTTLPDLEKAGVQVINCTENSALDAFKFLPLEEALNDNHR